MFKLLSKLKKDNRGEFMLGYIIVFPFLVMFMIYIIFAGAYWMKKNDMSTIANKKLDQALVKGQFTIADKNDLIAELDAKGFDTANLEITATPNVAYDDNDTTYATRETEIRIKVIHKKPHAFYYINKAYLLPVTESSFYIGIDISGMSEKW